MNPDFNTVARPYDAISRLVFGNALVEAQVSLLKHIPANSKVLIVGGGTGWILEELAKIHSTGLRIVYVEISSNMIARSQKRKVKNNEVSFINKPIEEYQSEELFDIVISPFFFDLFTKITVEKLFSHIDKSLKTNGLWLYTDFVPPKYQTWLWQKWLLKSMYLFFGILSKVEARVLVDMDGFFQENYAIVSENWFYRRFIRSNIYKKINVLDHQPDRTKDKQY